MRAPGDDGEAGLAMQPVRFPSKKNGMLEEFARQFRGCERRVRLMAGRAAAAAVCLRRLCQAFARGTQSRIELDAADAVATPLNSYSV